MKINLKFENKFITKKFKPIGYYNWKYNDWVGGNDIADDENWLVSIWNSSNRPILTYCTFLDVPVVKADFNNVPGFYFQDTFSLKDGIVYYLYDKEKTE